MKRILSSLSRADRPSLRIDTRQRSYGTLGGVPEEEFDVQQTHYDDELDGLDWEDQWEVELEERGLYRGTFSRLVLLYSLVPLTSLLTFAGLASLPFYIFPVTLSPFPELVFSISLYSLLHVIRLPLFQLLPYPVLHRLVITALTLLLRLVPLVVLNIPRATHHHPTWDQPAFVRVWWIALGWGAADVVAGIWQGYNHLCLYKDVLAGEPPASDDPNEINLLPARDNGAKLSRSSTNTSEQLELQIEHDLEQLLALKGREEVEEIYGMPFIRIPVFISCLLRVNALIHTLGLTLLLSAAFIRSSFSSSETSLDEPNNTQLYTTLALVFFIHFSVVSLHSPPFLPKVGIHTAAYVSFIVALGCWFAGMGVWEAVE